MGCPTRQAFLGERVEASGRAFAGLRATLPLLFFAALLAGGAAMGLSAPPASRAETAATDVTARPRPHHDLQWCRRQRCTASGVGNHTLNGRAGPDTTDGGLRDNLHEDLYIDRRRRCADLAPASTRYTPRSFHSVGNVEKLTLTVRAAIDGTGNAKRQGQRDHGHWHRQQPVRVLPALTR
jgi:hypothetical protein